MQINILSKLLKEKYPNSQCWVKEEEGRRTNTVCVVFNSPGKVYNYKGTIKKVAMTLELLPEINWEEEAEKVLNLFKENKNGHYMGLVGIEDNLKWRLHQEGMLNKEETLLMKDKGVQEYYKDEYDNDLTEYFIGKKLW